jgi:hypothetical protein
MSKSEIKFRELILRRLPGAYVVKMPDFKQTGSAHLRGMPDFMVCHGGVTMWYEVKLMKTKSTFSLSEMRPAQWVVFDSMLRSGVDVTLAVLMADGGFVLIPFSDVLAARLDGLVSLKTSVYKRL